MQRVVVERLALPRTGVQDLEDIVRAVVPVGQVERAADREALDALPTVVRERAHDRPGPDRRELAAARIRELVGKRRPLIRDPRQAAPAGVPASIPWMYRLGCLPTTAHRRPITGVRPELTRCLVAPFARVRESPATHPLPAPQRLPAGRAGSTVHLPRGTRRPIHSRDIARICTRLEHLGHSNPHNGRAPPTTRYCRTPRSRLLSTQVSRVGPEAVRPHRRSRPPVPSRRSRHAGTPRSCWLRQRRADDSRDSKHESSKSPRLVSRITRRADWRHSANRNLRLRSQDIHAPGLRTLTALIESR